MIDFKYVIQRDLKFHQNRYGISIIYGLGLDRNIETYINELRNVISNKLVDCFNWYELDRIHATLVRCTSKKEIIPCDKFWNHSFERELNEIPKFKLISKAVKLESDGAIRLYLESNNLPLPIKQNVLKEFENIIDSNLKLVKTPWFAIANMKPDLDLIKYVNSNYHEFYSCFTEKQLYLNVNCLKAVYFKDTGFRRYKVIREIKLK